MREPVFATAFETGHTSAAQGRHNNHLRSSDDRPEYGAYADLTR